MVVGTRTMEKPVMLQNWWLANVMRLLPSRTVILTIGFLFTQKRREF
jgi:hypothetical protein